MEYTDSAYGLTIMMYRTGHVATISTCGTTTQALNWRNTILELPEGLGPQFNLTYMLGQYVDNGGSCYITTIAQPSSDHPTGAIMGNANIPSGTTVHGSITYICQ